MPRCRCTAVLALLACLVADASAYIERIEEHPPCWDGQLQKSFQNGDKWTQASGCGEARCEQGSLVREECPLEGILLSGEYWQDGDSSAPFPACCGRKKSGCWRPDLQQWADVGDEWTGEGCTRAVCGESGSVSELPCGLIGLPPDSDGCRIELGDASASYPGCCASVNCSVCWAHELGRSVSVGEKWTLEGCSGQATCRGPGSYAAVGCPLMAVSPGVPCGLDDGEPDSDDYPSCCPKITCPDCYSETHQRFFGPDDEWTEPGCVMKRCSLNPDDSVSVLERNCPSAPDASCTLLQEGAEADFPHCCPIYECPNHCYSESKAQYFAIGEKWTEAGACSQFVCLKGINGTALPSTIPCELSQPPPYSNCSVEPGYSALDYPNCCPTYHCQDLCFSRERGQFFKPGDTWTELPCSRNTCIEGGRGGAVGCPAFLVGPGYVQKEGVAGGEYPSCCPTYVPISPPSPPPYRAPRPPAY